MKYDIVIIDEFASLMDNDSAAKEAIMHIMERGRSAGVFLFLIGQRLDAKVAGGKEYGGRAKANIVWSWSFAQRDATNARIAGVSGASKGLPPGQGILSSPREELLIETVLVTTEELNFFAKNFKKNNLTFQ